MLYPKRVVIDNGTSLIKVGFAGRDLPISSIETVIGKIKREGAERSTYRKHCYIGSEATAKRGLLDLSYPIDRGVITDAGDITRIWEILYSHHLDVPSQNYPVLLNEYPCAPYHSKQLIADIFFDKLDVPALSFVSNSALALYAAGQTSGVVFESGAGITYASPIYEGLELPAVEKIPFAGKDLDSYLLCMLEKRGIHFTSASEKALASLMKESICRVALNYDEELRDIGDSKSFILPDGTTIRFERECLEIGEALFNPDLTGRETPGISQLVHKMIKKCDIDVRAHLCKNVVISGGTTLMSNFPQRLYKELLELFPTNVYTKLIAAPDRQFSVWIGGSILAMTSTFTKMCISSEEYFEFGNSILKRK